MALFKTSLLKHAISFDAISASLKKMEVAISENNDKLDRMLTVRRGWGRSRIANVVLLSWTALPAAVKTPRAHSALTPLLIAPPTPTHHTQLLEQGKLTQRPSDVIEWADVHIDENGFVGEGGFGKVYKGEWASNAVAVKFLSGAALLAAWTRGRGSLGGGADSY